VIAGNRVVFGADDGRLYLLDMKDGALVWQYEIGQPIKTSPAVGAGLVLVGAEDGCVYAFGAKK
jgi:eukaryotic-like serine/threonine-protein kinase